MKTVTIETKTGSEEWPVTDLRVQAYRALKIAAERIARNNSADYQRQAKRYGSYRISAEHEIVIQAMPLVLDGKLDPEDAMGLINSYEVTKARLTS